MTKFLDPSLKIGAATITGVKRTNLVANPSFEVDTSGWSVSSGYSAILSRSSAQPAPVAGTSTLLYNSTAADGSSRMQIAFAVVPGATYTASATAWASNSGRTGRVELVWTSATSVVTSTLGTTVSVTGSSPGTRLSVTGTAPSDVASAVLVVMVIGTPNGEGVYLDGVMVETSSKLNTYFDGDTAGAHWLGTTGKSTSETGVLDAGNMSIVNVPTPVASKDATNKTYVDTAAALKVAKTGDSMTGPLTVSVAQSGFAATLANTVVGHGLAIGVGAATNYAWTSSVTGDAFARLATAADGKHSWGSGAGSQDTNLYRSAADLLRTDDVFQAAAVITTLSAKTANYTLTGLDAVVVSNGTALTMTLPSAATAGAGRVYTVKNINSSAVTVASTSGTIDGAATASLSQWGAGTYTSDGTNWVTVVVPSLDPTAVVNDAAIASIMGVYR